MWLVLKSPSRACPEHAAHALQHNYGMSKELARPFESIESAQEFMVLLEESIVEAAREIEDHHKRAVTAREPRRAEALALTV